VPGIAEALTAAGPRGGAAPAVPLLLATMPDELRTQAEALLASTHSDRTVADAFCEDGYQLSPNAIRSHRMTHRLQRFARPV